MSLVNADTESSSDSQRGDRADCGREEPLNFVFLIVSEVICIEESTQACKVSFEMSVQVCASRGLKVPSSS
jgi:hypothetical protein